KVNSQPVIGKVYHPNVPFAIGADPTSDGNGGVPLHGQVALAKLYSKALTSSEIVAAYNEFTNRTKLEELNALYEEIGKAKETLAGSYEFGEKPGQYSQAAFTELQTSYNGAKAVFENMVTTGEQAVGAYQSLKTAHQTFIQSKVVDQKPETPKEKLQKTIDAAKALLAKVQVGQEPGQYQESPVKALEEKIKVAESVVKDTKVKDQYVETMNRTLEYAMQLVEKSVNE
ncbi:acid phosphatase, partial [Bacillus pseudomycoides]